MGKFIESKTWTGGEGTLETLDLGPSIANSPRKKPKEGRNVKATAPSAKITGSVKHYSLERGFGFVHLDNGQADVEKAADVAKATGRIEDRVKFVETKRKFHKEVR